MRFNRFKKIQRIVNAYCKNKPIINIDIIHNEKSNDLHLAKQLEKIINLEVKREINKRSKKMDMFV